MEKPFPELTELSCSSSEGNEMPILPQSFLGGSAPHLRTLYLDEVPPLAVQSLLLSANNLIYLSLQRIPDSGYNSPEDMANCLSGLTRLETLILHFRPARSLLLSQVSRQLLSTPTPSVLPTLTEFEFQGRTCYLERLVARIDAPLLLKLRITSFHDDVFDVPQLRRLISHAEKLGTHARATVSYFNNAPRLRLSSQPWTVDSPTLTFWISNNSFSYPFLPVSSLAQVCKSSFPPISTLDELEIIGACPIQVRQNAMEQRMQWLELLALFTSLKILRLGKPVALTIMRALKGLAGERERAMLPTLQSLFIGGFQSSAVVQDVVEQFVTARQLSDMYISVHDWK